MATDISIKQISEFPSTVETINCSQNASNGLPIRPRYLILRSFSSFVNKMVRRVSIAQAHRSSYLQDQGEVGSRTSLIFYDFARQIEKLSCNNGWKTAGVCGLRNHGNTCFMNSILQCLNNTEQLVAYLLSDQFKTDMKQSSKLMIKKGGHRCELTDQLAILVHSLWSCKYSPEISSQMKSLVVKFGQQYRNSAQQDAQEFLLWLLDHINDDLSLAVKKKKHKKIVNLHLDSLNPPSKSTTGNCIQDLFQAWHFCSLTCSSCGHKSSTFDPFLSLSLPLPPEMRSIIVTVVYLSATPKQVRIGLQMPADSTMQDVRLALQRDTSIPENQIILSEIKDDGIITELGIKQMLFDYKYCLHIYAIETPPYNLVPNNIVFVIQNRFTETDGLKKFGEPFVFSGNLNISLIQLQRNLLNCMSTRVNNPANLINMSSVFIAFSLHSTDGKQIQLSAYVDHPFKQPSIEEEMGPFTGEQKCVFLTAFWELTVIRRFHVEITDFYVEHESCTRIRGSNAVTTCQLTDCFDVYTKHEQLGADDAWLCPNCQNRQQGTLKSIALWSLPHILIIHLKRFKQEVDNRRKLNTFVKFPITNLDLSNYVSTKSISSPISGEVAFKTDSSKSAESGNNDKFLYDLYAVCNHYGDLHSGHYTAFCRNPLNYKWYDYNDSQAFEMQDESDVVTEAAYVLFYERHKPNSRSTSFAMPVNKKKTIDDHGAQYNESAQSEIGDKLLETSMADEATTAKSKRSNSVLMTCFAGQHSKSSDRKLTTNRKLSASSTEESTALRPLQSSELSRLHSMHESRL